MALEVHQKYQKHEAAVAAAAPAMTRKVASDGYRFYNVKAYTNELATVSATLYIHMEDNANESSLAHLKELSSNAFRDVSSKYTINDMIGRRAQIATEVKEELNKTYTKLKMGAVVERVQFEELVLSETIESKE